MSELLEENTFFRRRLNRGLEFHIVAELIAQGRYQSAPISTPFFETIGFFKKHVQSNASRPPRQSPCSWPLALHLECCRILSFHVTPGRDLGLCQTSRADIESFSGFASCQTSSCFAKHIATAGTVSYTHLTLPTIPLV